MSAIRNPLGESTFPITTLTASKRAGQEQVEKEKQEQLERENKVIATLPEPDYEYEAKKVSAPIEYLTFVSLGWDPQEINKKRLNIPCFIGSNGEKYRKRLALLKNAAYSEGFGDRYAENIYIQSFIEWAERVELDIDMKFAKLVKKYHPKTESTDWEAECKKKDDEYKKIKSVLKTTKSELKSLKEIHEGVNKILYAMIINEPYNFDMNSKNHCTSKILKNFKDLKVKLSDGIVRARCAESVKFCEDSIPLEELRKEKK